MPFYDMQDFSAWQETWCKTCRKPWQDCQVLSEIYLAGGSTSIGEGPGASPETSAYCTQYERDYTSGMDIEGTPI